MSERALEFSSVISIPPAPAAQSAQARVPFFIIREKLRSAHACLTMRAAERRVGKYRSLRKSSSLSPPPVRLMCRKRTSSWSGEESPLSESCFHRAVLRHLPGEPSSLFCHAVSFLSFPACGGGEDWGASRGTLYPDLSRRLQGEDVPLSSTCLNAWSSFPVRRHSSEEPHSFLQVRLQSFRSTKKPACPQTPADRLVQLRKRRGGYGVTPALSGIRGC